MPKEADPVAPSVYSFFTAPVRSGDLVNRARAEAVPPTQQAADLMPVQSPLADRAQALRELVAARRLCGQLRADDRCPGECVTAQLARGVPLRELSGLAAFREVQNRGGLW